MAIPFSYSFRNLWTRKLTSILTASGMALVTFVFAAVLMLAEGLEKTLIDTGSPENAIVLRGSAETEVSSVIDRRSAQIISVQPEVAQGPEGEFLASKETQVLVTLPKAATGTPTNVVVRGVGPHSMKLRPRLKIIAGRNIRPGSHEVIVGKSAATSIQDSSIGSVLNFALSEWKVVGIFDSGGSAFDSEIWADCDQLMSAFRRNSFSAVIMRVRGAKAFRDLQKRLESDPRLSVQVQREIDFYRGQSEVMARFIRILGLAMTLFFSVGAVLGAMVTMYTAVANRTHEIGTLRALGFRRASVLMAFLTESAILGVIGGFSGVLAGSSLQFVTISTMNWQTFSELAFGFTLTVPIAIYSLVFSISMGLLGGALPAWRAAHLEIVEALRAS